MNSLFTENMRRSAQRIVAAPKAVTAGEAEEAEARLARNCGKPGFCASKNAPIYYYFLIINI